MSGLLHIRVDEKRYGERAVLRGLELELKEGEIVSLIGASGCGKSSLLAILAGLDQHWRGAIRLDGSTLHGVSSQIGIIFQEPRLFPWLSVARNIAFGCPSGGENALQVELLLEEVGLAGLGERLPKQLSGGQAQRAAIARGLFTRPRILLLDEPFSAVDAFTRMKLQDLLSRIARQHGLTVLLVTHDIDEALYLSDRILMLDNSPGPLRAEFHVRADYPRSRSDARLATLRTDILDALHAAHAI
jgi:sulfonate transport system ATP-binding protein